MRKLIGITGKARSGKDTVARYLWERYGYTRIAFADPLKAAAQQMFGLSHEATWSDELKETIVPYWNKSPRQIFQLLGTECVKPHFGDDIWIKRFCLSANALPEDDIVVPDVRFEPEARFIRESGGTIVHLFREDAVKVNAHVSEAGIHPIASDFFLYNDRSLQDLHAAIDDLVASLP